MREVLRTGVVTVLRGYHPIMLEWAIGARPPAHEYVPERRANSTGDTLLELPAPDVTYTVCNGKVLCNDGPASGLKKLHNRCARPEYRSLDLAKSLPAPIHSPDRQNISHDAWRSTKQRSGDPFALRQFEEMPSATRDTSLQSDHLAVQSLFEHFASRSTRPRLDSAAVYGTMHALYRGFLYNKNWNDFHRPCDLPIDERVIEKISTNDSRRDGYDALPAAYKETDRRIIIAAISTLADDTVPIWHELPDRRELLRDPAVEHAIEDGRTILAAASSPTPYDRSEGFALDAVF